MVRFAECQNGGRESPRMVGGNLPEWWVGISQNVAEEKKAILIQPLSGLGQTFHSALPTPVTSTPAPPPPHSCNPLHPILSWLRPILLHLPLAPPLEETLTVT